MKRSSRANWRPPRISPEKSPRLETKSWMLARLSFLTGLITSQADFTPKLPVVQLPAHSCGSLKV
jgi:hypothetical protein